MNKLLTKLANFTSACHPEVINYDELQHSSIFLPLIKVAGKASLLFEKRTSNITQGGEICFPGGRVNPDEIHNPLITAIRETSEELGVTADKIDIAARLPRLITPDGKLIDAFIGKLINIELSNLAINPDEVEKIFTIPLASVKEIKFEQYLINSANHSGVCSNNPKLLPVEKLGLPERYQGSWGTKSYNVYYTEWKNEKIWGLTARYLKYLQELL